MATASPQAASSWRSISFTILALTVLALLPWWRNHKFLTDFYDYGLVISGVGRVAAGERLYADIVSPIQSAIFLLNGAVEKIGGGTFQAMTLGGAYLIAFATAALVFILSRRWSILGAAGVAAGILFGSVVQHTIIWHNTVGVLCLAFAVWGAALAPTLRRATWPWHALVVTGLWLGGINKLNFHFVALGMACGWTLRATLTGGENWRRVALTLASWLTAGAVLPLLTELLWSGATLADWWHNVVELPLASRTGALSQIRTWQFYLASPHVYYGALRLPQIGLVSVAFPLVAGLAAWRWSARTGAGDKIILVIAVLLAIVAGAALHATNNEIGYVGLAAALVLTVGLWLGFGLPPRGLPFWLGLVIPALLTGAVSWESAWRGQRSQFGHSSARRETYLPAETANPAYSYLRGTKLPPEMHGALSAAATWLNTVERRGLHPVFYGPGLEWLERVFPAVKPGPMPLLAQWGTTYGPTELNRLHRALEDDQIYPAVLSIHAWDAWTFETQLIFNFRFRRSSLGELIDLRQRCGQPSGLIDAIAFANDLVGNTVATSLDFAGTAIGPHSDSAQKPFLGVTQGEGRLALHVPIRRMESEAIVHRLSVGAEISVYADFRATSHATGEARWSARLALPVGQRDASLSFTAGGNSEPIDLIVTIPAAFQNQLAAGFRNARITDIGADTGPAPYLRLEKPADESFDAPPQFLGGSWSPDKITLRAGRVTPAGVELRAGGELWLYSRDGLTELSGSIFRSPGSSGAAPAVARIVWYKSGRLQVLQQEGLPDPTSKIHFRAWSAEPEGWFGILTDPIAGGPPVTIEILKAEPAPR